MEIAVTRKRGRPKKKFRGVPFKKKNVVNFQESTVVQADQCIKEESLQIDRDMTRKNQGLFGKGLDSPLLERSDDLQLQGVKVMPSSNNVTVTLEHEREVKVLMPRKKNWRIGKARKETLKQYFGTETDVDGISDWDLSNPLPSPVSDMEELEDDSDATYQFDSQINLEDLIDSAIQDLCNPQTCRGAREWRQELLNFQPSIKLIERRQREINKLFHDCQLQLDNFKENLEEAEKNDEKLLKEAKKAFAEAAIYPSEVVIDGSDKEEDQNDGDDDDDVQIIEKSPTKSAIVRTVPKPASDRKPLDEKNVPKDDSLKAQTREKLTTALNNATGNQQPRSIQIVRKYLTDTLDRQSTVSTSKPPHGSQYTAQRPAKQSSDLGQSSLSDLRSSSASSSTVSSSLASLVKSSSSPNAVPSKPMRSLNLLFPNEPPPTSTTQIHPETLSALQKKTPTQVSQYSTSLANQEKMEKLYLEDVNNIKLDTLVLYKRYQDLWDKGVLLDILNADKPVSDRKYKVKCEYKKGPKLLTSKQIAFSWSIPKPLTVGTRIVALYKEDDSEGAFYAGIIAEAPNGRNEHRYLVFFDDGYAQYCTSKEIYKVFYQSKPVWLDIHPDSQEFVRDYLARYPERPMVRLHRGQSVKTEWNGKWWNARVEEVDASLVSMYFSADQRSEWIYRGSTRLEPLYTALANAEANRNAGKIKRHNLWNQGPKAPVVEYMRNLSSDSPAKPEKDKKKSVARKSTTPQSALNTGKVWEAPWMKKKAQVDVKPSTTPPTSDKYSTTTISNKATKDKDMATILQERLVSSEDKANIDLEALGTRLNQKVPLRDKDKIFYHIHQCSSKCMSGGENSDKFKGTNPLLAPLFEGWERHVAKMKPSGRRVIFYQAPCGRRLRSMEELDKYLLITDCIFAIDSFCFDAELHVNYEFIPVKTFCDIKDISYGKENVQISCVNGIDRQYPDYVDYSNQRIPAAGVKLNLEPEFLVCCDCTDNCRNKSKCACQQLTVESSAITNGGKPNPDAGYKHRRLPEPLISGVYECNSRCSCDSRCVNKVVQNGLSNRLQVFKTEKRGWGLRCLDDIPRGGFICIYAGQLLTDQGANEDGQQYGDEYLAELDYMEVVERHKEGYESDVEDIDEGLENDELEEEEEEEEDEIEDTATASDSDESFTSNQKRSIAKIEEKSHQTRRSMRQLNNKDGKSRLSQSREIASKEIPLGFTKKKSKQTAHKSTTLPPKNKPSGSPVDVELPELNDQELSSSSNDQTEIEPKKKRTGRSTAARYGSMVPTKKDKDGNDSEELKFKPTRDYFREDDDEADPSCYIMDAKSMGNIGRYLNHSCQPCAFVQNVFVDTHDLRFPWIAFFAGQYICAGTELTWDYNYEVGSVPGKVLYCYCGSAECRGRLL